MNTKHSTQNKSAVIGDVGEFLVQRDLERKGYNVGIYGKAINDRKSSGTLKADGAQVFDDGCGYSFLTYHPLTDYKSFPESRLFDYTEDDIASLCKTCREKYGCELSQSKHPPCAIASFPFDKRSWDSTYSGIDSLFYSENKAKGLLPKCQTQLQEIAMSEAHSDLIIDAEFIRDNQKVNKYIQCIWRMHCSGEEYGGSHSFPAGHPGRYDFVAEKQGVYAPIEVKVNSSKLSHWQRIRLSLLWRLGYSSMVAKVKIGKTGVDQALNGEEPSEYNIEYEDYKECDEQHTIENMNSVLFRFENLPKPIAMQISSQNRVKIASAGKPGCVIILALIPLAVFSITKLTIWLFL